MGDFRRHLGRSLAAAIALILMLIAAMGNLLHLKAQHRTSISTLFLQNFLGVTEEKRDPSLNGSNRVEQEQWELEAAGRRRLAGPGSSPPTCRSRCGHCFPCRPVHVPVQPGHSMPLEYYPEAWRCKCGNKLFMP
ncbi:Epidermal patterning factor-like protein 4 [Apostasia shenzhenica]|uniref:Epidermal patterning factor-like protein n=1 Tax=Apostasia shenzhenica TaxID=1088818 RepID=A0A2I0ARW5_9ASPA|nr:Epidermal patterning factor-like protein 4 [Apostasia shenzhenica]